LHEIVTLEYEGVYVPWQLRSCKWFCLCLLSPFYFLWSTLPNKTNNSARFRECEALQILHSLF